MIKKILLIPLIFAMMTSLLAYNFGKNKIQAYPLEWSFIQTMHFDIYFNKGDDEFGKIAALLAEEAYYYLKQDFKTPVMNRIPVIFYKSHQDFETTNVIFPLLNEGVGGFTESGRNRIAIPFDGSYRAMEETFIHELTHAYINELNRSRNRFLNLTGLPFWFSEGLPEFESVGGKSVYNNMFIIDLLMNDGIPDITDIGGFFAYRLGESFLTFISDEYGRKTVMDMFYALRISHSSDQAIEKVFGIKFRELQKRWQNYLKRKYFKYITDYEIPYEVYQKMTDHKETGAFMNFASRFSPDGFVYLYFSDKDLKSDIWKGSVYSTAKPEKIINGGMSGKFQEFHYQRNNIAWFPDGKAFAFVSKTATGDKIYVIDYLTEKIIQTYKMPGFDSIYEIDISHDGEKLVFTGQKKLSNDIYIMNLKTGEISQITSDPYNDYQPRWSPRDDKILFTSERTIISDPEEKHVFNELNNNIFYYDLDLDKFYQVTSDSTNSYYPIWNSVGDKIIFVTEQDFFANFNVIDLTNGNRAEVTRILGSVFTGDLNYNDSKLIFSCYYDLGWDIYIKEMPLENLSYYPYHLPFEYEFKDDFAESFELDRYKFYGKRAVKFRRELPEYYTENHTTLDLRGEPDLDSLNYKYNRFLDEKPTEIKPPEIMPYKVKFSLDNLWGGMAYSPSGGTFAQLQLSLSDLLGDHAIGINVGISGELEKSDFVFNYLYMRHRIDYGVGGFFVNDEVIYRIRYSSGENDDYMREREREYGIYGILRYPLNKFWRIDFENVLYKHEIWRDWWDGYNDEWIKEYIPDYFDEEAYEKELVYVPQFSFVHDNSLYGSVGPISGWRGVLLLNRSFSTDNSSSIIYSDIRKYLFFAKRFSFAFRILGGTIIGVSNQRFELDYFNGVRGFDDDTLQGKRKMLGSIELRFPLVDNLKLAFPLPLHLANIRGSVFADAGAIWDDTEKLKLYEDEQLKDLKFGFGFGPRIYLGYFVLKLDVAWQSDFKKVSRPFLYLSLSPDF
ncbi:MAG: PD40 domain-containing protein [Candidatus Cloacimonetes bacterium]|nr:PD40 domain-containing protein [Candidatus Cloacimonadota bacterium]